MIGQCNICIGMSIRCDVEVPKLWYKHNPNDVANADEVTILKYYSSLTENKKTKQKKLMHKN